MKARVSHLHKTEADWSKLSTWVPEAGELIIYDPDHLHKYSRIKIGDGVHTLNEIAFSIESSIDTALNQHKFKEVIDAGRVTEYK